MILPAVPRAEWRAPSQRRSVYGIEDVTRWRIEARLDDGHVVWRAWFDDRDDVDAFLWALARGTLKLERALWELPTPAWHPGIAPFAWYTVATLVFLTSSTGSNQTYTSPTDWNNADNTVEVIGAGGSGNSQNSRPDGGGGGAYSKISNFSFAAPGTTTATRRVGTGGAAVQLTGTGNAGGDSWFDGASLGAASVGAKGGSGASSSSGGAGGAAGSGVGTVKYSGGDGSTGEVGEDDDSGGGGAAGPAGDGEDGSLTAGGDGDAGNTAGPTSTSAGTTGQQWDPTHGSGSGGYSASTSGRAGGAYGGGGSGADLDINFSGAGYQGIVVLTYTVAAVVPGGLPRQTRATHLRR